MEKAQLASLGCPKRRFGFIHGGSNVAFCIVQLLSLLSISSFHFSLPFCTSFLFHFVLLRSSHTIICRFSKSPTFILSKCIELASLWLFHSQERCGMLCNLVDLMACLEVKKRRESRIEGEKVI